MDNGNQRSRGGSSQGESRCVGLLDNNLLAYYRLCWVGQHRGMNNRGVFMRDRTSIHDTNRRTHRSRYHRSEFLKLNVIDRNILFDYSCFWNWSAVVMAMQFVNSNTVGRLLLGRCGKCSLDELWTYYFAGLI